MEEPHLDEANPKGVAARNGNASTYKDPRRGLWAPILRLRKTKNVG